ncbi:MAG: OsmC family protein [Hymenobacteraceae bacterium]|nr:OsmC family protein [Hymenobacteraceae bacterium]MDX5396700.1 OsmC family protein [Hymenobacteraceae bacterium]MDX5442959.1 OsmC family protein [Hymenobacteraceae bacterium]MDX5512760.1 OsmC family protein [Hymenobacteraceae bacterium]
MPTITSRYAGNLRTEATHIASNNTVITDAPVDNNGRGEAFSPTDLVCAALGSCMMTIMGIVAERNQINLEGMRIETTKLMASDPRRIAEVILEFHMPDHEFSNKEKAILENAALTCPVALSLHPDVKQMVHFHYVPEEEITPAKK